MHRSQQQYAILGCSVVTAILSFCAVFMVAMYLDRPATPPPSRPSVKTLVDAARRLELRGYRHVSHGEAMGMKVSNYARELGHARYTATIIRWTGDQEIAMVQIQCIADDKSFESGNVWGHLCREAGEDLVSLVTSRSDYGRAVAALEERDGDYTGKAMSFDGWEFTVVWHTFYRRDQRRPAATVTARHIETFEQMPDETARLLQDFTRAAELMEL